MRSLQFFITTIQTKNYYPILSIGGDVHIRSTQLFLTRLTNPVQVLGLSLLCNQGAIEPEFSLLRVGKINVEEQKSDLFGKYI